MPTHDLLAPGPETSHVRFHGFAFRHHTYPPGWLSRGFNINFPEEMPFLSDELTRGHYFFGSTLQLAISRNKGVLSDYRTVPTTCLMIACYEIGDNLEITSCTE